MVRSVNNFLTAEERQQISDFINCKKKESSTHVREDNRIIDKEQKKRRTKKIEELRQKKYKQWKARVDNISSDKTQTWHTKIENGEVECPINEFLILFKKIIENPLLLGEERELLKKLEHALCGYDCPCPTD